MSAVVPSVGDLVSDVLEEFSAARKKVRAGSDRLDFNPVTHALDSLVRYHAGEVLEISRHRVSRTKFGTVERSLAEDAELYAKKALAYCSPKGRDGQDRVTWPREGLEWLAVAIAWLNKSSNGDKSLSREMREARTFVADKVKEAIEEAKRATEEVA